MKVVSENCGTAPGKVTNDTIVDVSMKKIYFWSKRCVIEIDGQEHEMYLGDTVRVKKAPVKRAKRTTKKTTKK